jgi:hypothetical protein
MLRIGFLPSDFNPMVLVLGETEDLHALAGVLRRFARDRADIRLDTLAFCAPGRTRLTRTGTAGQPGIQDSGESLCWRLDPPLAAAFAERVESVAEPGRVAGSELLACGIAEEIPVKISRGEYTDDFLLPTT